MSFLHFFTKTLCPETEDILNDPTVSLIAPAGAWNRISCNRQRMRVEVGSGDTV